MITVEYLGESAIIFKRDGVDFRINPGKNIMHDEDWAKTLIAKLDDFILAPSVKAKAKTMDKVEEAKTKKKTKKAE